MLSPGSVLDSKYRVIRLIGEGGMGAVYECEHEAIRRHVAVKVLFPQFANDAEAVLRFHREAQAAGRIGHDNICEVIDIGRLPAGAPYLVMPLLKGEPLSAIIQREAPLPPGRAIDLAAQVLDALGAAHCAGIVHRDLKPDNLFITHLGGRNIEFVKVVDFGISKILGQASVNDQHQVTRTGMVMGTPCYMAPEQARGAKDVDHRADLYAMGTILYELLTGKRAFDGDTFNEVLIKVVVDPFPPPRVLRPEIPVELEAVVLRAMDRDRTLRPQTAEDFRKELLAALDASRSGVVPRTTNPDSVAGALAAGAIGLAESATVVDPASAPARAGGPAGDHPETERFESRFSVVPTPGARLSDVTRQKPSPAGAPHGRLGIIVAAVGAATVAGVLVYLFVGRGGREPPSSAAPARTTVTAPSEPPSGDADGRSLAIGAASPVVVPLAPEPAVAVAAVVPTVPPHGVVSAPPSPPPAVVGPETDAGPSAAPVPPTDAGASATMVKISLVGVPEGATVRVGEETLDGTETSVPRSAETTRVSVALHGYETFRTEIVPSEDRVVQVRLRRAGADPRVAAPAERDAGTADAGREDVRTVSGRLGTTLIDEYGQPP